VVSVANWLGLVVGAGLIIFPEPATTLTGVAVVIASLGIDEIDAGDV